MIESNKTICKKCQQMKTRTEDGKYPNSKNKRYIDDQGKLWNGKTCPDCQKNKTKENMKQMRFNRQLEKKDDDQTSS
jgi:hypothetical protein